MGEKDLSVRKLRAGEEEAFIRSARIPFLDPVGYDPQGASEIRRSASELEVDRAWVVDDGGVFAGQCAIDSLDLTLPAAPGRTCPVVPMAGITAVGVHPTHRRRGLLRQMMAEMIADAVGRGEAVAGLVASESAIYGRFGFGHATDRVELSIETAHSAFSVPAPDVDIRLVEPASAAEALSQMYDRQRTGRPGEVGRSPLRWELILADDPSRRGSAGRGMFVAVCTDGYIRYRNHPRRMLEPELGRIVVEELRGRTPDVEAALWRFVLDLDLVDEVTAPRRPVDEPLQWRLADPRRLHLRGSEDMLHVKILDVGRAFEARGYQTSGVLILQVTPPPGGSGDDPALGTWVLDAGADGASCTRAGGVEPQPDIVLDSAALGSVYLGGFAPSVLAGAGRVREVSPGKLLVADQLLASRPAPLTTTGF